MKRKLLGIIPLILIVGLSACNLPSGEPTATLPPSDTPVPAEASPTLVILTQEATISPTPLPGDPLVLRATLCWMGPGAVYPTVSALKVNERVKLLGRGSISGWYIVENPIYHDPCWVQASELQIDPGTDLTNLRVFNPPPTPTYTKPPATHTPPPTATPTP